MLLKAHPHEWGPGKVHLLVGDESKTYCGKQVSSCPGDVTDGEQKSVTCVACLKAIEGKKKREENEAKWKAEMEEREAEKERKNREWWAWYNEYLQSDEWWRRRRLVINRAKGYCEGCGTARCTQVHHLTYERAGNEMLFDLVAVCDECHEQLHPDEPEDDPEGLARLNDCFGSLVVDRNQ